MPAGIPGNGSRAAPARSTTSIGTSKNMSMTRRGRAKNWRVDYFTRWRASVRSSIANNFYFPDLLELPRNFLRSARPCSFAQYKIDHGESAEEVLSVANYFCNSARARIDHYFAGARRNVDKLGYQLTQELLAGKHSSLREGIVR